MPLPALLIPLIFWTGIAALSSWAVSRALPLSATQSIEIDAPVEDIWNVITDPERISEWNDHIVLLNAPAGLTAGKKLRMRARHPETQRLRASFRATVTRFEPNQEFTWEAKILFKWLLAASNTITVSALECNRTEVTQTLSFEGVLSPGIPFLTSIGNLQEASNTKLKRLLEEA